MFEHNKKIKDKDALVDEVRRIIRSSIGNRAKEGLIVDFIHETDLEPIQDKADVISAFFSYAQKSKRKKQTS